eukprot:scaffold3639_cov48-Phaeocystis_antarctica.AAC.2
MSFCMPCSSPSPVLAEQASTCTQRSLNCTRSISTMSSAACSSKKRHGVRGGSERASPSGPGKAGAVHGGGWAVGEVVGEVARPPQHACAPSWRRASPACWRRRAWARQPAPPRPSAPSVG